MLEHYFFLLRKYSAYFLITICLLFTIKAIHVTFTQVFDEDPNHCREAAENIIPLLINEGVNPFCADYSPPVFATYGPVSALLAAPFSHNMNAARKTQRIFSGLSLFLVIILMCWGCNSSPYSALNLGLILICTLMILPPVFISNEIGSKSGNIGLLLAMASVVVPFKFNYKYQALAFGSICLALSIYTKTYYILFSPILPIYLLFYSKIRAITSALLLILSLVLFGFIFEFFFPNSLAPIFTAHNQIELSNAHFIGNLKHIWHFYGFFFLISFFYYIKFATIIFKEIKRVDFRKLDEPALVLLRPHPELLPFLASVILLVLYCITIGRHTGNSIVYISHTFLPFIAWFTAVSLQKIYSQCSKSHGLALLMSGIIFIPALQLYALNRSYNLNQFEPSYKVDRDKLQVFIDASQNPLGNRLTAYQEHEYGKTPEDYGLTEYFKSNRIITDSKGLIHFNPFESYVALIQESLLAHNYDLVICLNGTNIYTNSEWLLNNGYVEIYKQRFRTSLYHYTLSYFAPFNLINNWHELIKANNKILENIEN
jgi:hypothetical protein